MNIQLSENIRTFRKERSLTQEQLARTLMPLAEYTKDEVRRIAMDAGLVVAGKKDSQEICFVLDGG